MNIIMTAVEDVSVFRFNGFLNYESIARVRSIFNGKASTESKMVFNLDALNFVGSIGITDFVEVILQVNKECPNGVALCGVSTEFQRVISAKNASLAFFHSETQAVSSFSNMQSAQQFLEREDLMDQIGASSVGATSLVGPTRSSEDV